MKIDYRPGIRKGYTKKKKYSRSIKQSTNAQIRKLKNNCTKRNKKYHTHHKCNVLFHLEKGTLTKFGYSMKKSQQSRHKSLKKQLNQ